MNFQFRISIFDLLGRTKSPCRLSAGYQNCGNFVSFIKQWLDTPCGQQRSLNRDFQPKAAFIRFLFDNGSFVHKVLTGFGPAKCAVIGANGATASHELISIGVTTASVGNGINEFERSQREFLASLFHFFFSHSWLLDRKSKTENRNSHGYS
jgi:hypothetical protein